MNWVFIVLIKIYQRFISPFLPFSCRFEPTCSQYMIESMEKYGLLKGFWLGFIRILKCNPFHDGGYNPVK